ncbi:MAG: sulfotransferase, partial [Candidatus Eremiobacteraeota bacterium]|nr:sulfotransferase [Candidatus Eremiobacteraeota bacterium]
SGTTLIEQILASHPDVYGAGELSLFEDAVDDVVGDGDSVSAEAMLAASCDTIRALGRRYAENLRARAPSGVARVTDKMPANFRYFGLIAIALPKARLIHAKRDPADTCLSCFEQNFAGGQGFAYDLAELGRYYRGYQKLTAHWRSVLSPDALLEVQYEDVVADIEAQARRIVAFCGLDWDERCLEFYRLKRPVRTASVAQVRRPIYNSSVHKSRQYGDLLKPLLDELEKPTSLFR